jgi:hypothetical protein
MTPADINQQAQNAGGLLTSIGMFYALWYPEIGRALDLVRHEKGRNNGLQQRKVMRTLLTLSVPLFVWCSGVLFVFHEPLAVALKDWNEESHATVGPFVLICASFVVVLIHSLGLCIRLARFHSSLGRDETSA